MAKQSRKKLRRLKPKSYRKKTSKAGRSYKKMVGGTFTQEETQQLLSLGFTENDIQILFNTGLGLNIIQLSLNRINPDTGANFTPQELIQDIQNNENNGLNISGISDTSDDEHELDESMNTTIGDISYLNGINHSQGSLHLSDLNDTRNSQGSLHLSDLNDSRVSQGSLHLSDLDDSRVSQGSLHLSDLGNLTNDSVNTTRDNSFGGRKRKTYSKTKKGRKARKYNRKSRKQKGGMCFGNGVGANSYDPNYSIYNTNMLKLFPYRPS